MKKITSVFISLFLMLSVFLVSVCAAGVPVITYSGGSSLSYTDAKGNPLTGNSDFGTAFSGMIPGKTYTQEIKLQNKDTENTIRFYMDLSVLETLKASQLDGAGYTVILESGGDVLYSSVNGTRGGTLIGGSGSTGELTELNKEFLSQNGNGILVATLTPGTDTSVSLSITADASMSDAYQGAKGTMSFQFFGEIVPPQKTQIINKYKTIYVTGGVPTGDGRPVYITAAVLVAAVIVFFILGRKKDKKLKNA